MAEIEHVRRSRKLYVGVLSKRSYLCEAHHGPAPAAVVVDAFDVARCAECASGAT